MNDSCVLGCRVKQTKTTQFVEVIDEQTKMSKLLISLDLKARAIVLECKEHAALELTDDMNIGHEPRS
jgi:hypothetical protein